METELKFCGTNKYGTCGGKTFYNEITKTIQKPVYDPMLWLNTTTHMLSGHILHTLSL